MVGGYTLDKESLVLNTWSSKCWCSHWSSCIMGRYWINWSWSYYVIAVLNITSYNSIHCFITWKCIENSNLIRGSCWFVACGLDFSSNLYHERLIDDWLHSQLWDSRRLKEVLYIVGIVYCLFVAYWHQSTAS